MLITIAFLILLSAMSPGPDFAVVTKNTIAYSRIAGLYTALGVSCAVWIHATYCALGLAFIVAKSPSLFLAVKLIGGSYLIYIGIKTLLAKSLPRPSHTEAIQHVLISNGHAFRQGFFTNLSNPKCMLFFFALFTVIVHHAKGLWINLAMIVLCFVITLGWFCTLTYILSHQRLDGILKRWQIVIIRITGIWLIGLGLLMFFVHATSH